MNGWIYFIIYTVLISYCIKNTLNNYDYESFYQASTPPTLTPGLLISTVVLISIVYKYHFCYHLHKIWCDDTLLTFLIYLIRILLAIGSLYISEVILLPSHLQLFLILKLWHNFPLGPVSSLVRWGSKVTWP